MKYVFVIYYTTFMKSIIIKFGENISENWGWNVIEMIVYVRMFQVWSYIYNRIKNFKMSILNLCYYK